MDVQRTKKTLENNFAASRSDVPHDVFSSPSIELVVWASWAAVSPPAAMLADDDPEAETRECIRRLVGVIRQSSTGDSPLDHMQLEHIKKVIRVLSLSEEQVAGMRMEERVQVLNIRKNALAKMRLANTATPPVKWDPGSSLPQVASVRHPLRIPPENCERGR